MLQKINIGTRLNGLIGIALLVAVLFGVSGIFSSGQAQKSLQSVYEERMQRVQELTLINELMTDNKTLLLTVFSEVDIAFSQNHEAMLEINSIEAARAGQGKGFAVVAAEVRKLAEPSQINAREIGTLAHDSVVFAEGANGLLNTIVPSIDKTSELIKTISNASLKQTTGVNQIKDAMSQISFITQQNALASEELAATAEEMASPEQLKELMSFFSINKVPVNEVPIERRSPNRRLMGIPSKAYPSDNYTMSADYMNKMTGT